MPPALEDDANYLMTADRFPDNTPDVYKRQVLVTPTYAWRIPRAVSEWLGKTELTGAAVSYTHLDVYKRQNMTRAAGEAFERLEPDKRILMYRCV